MFCICICLTNTQTHKQTTNISVIPAAVTTSKTAVATIAYSMILADTLRALLSTGGYNLSRQSTLLGLTGGILLPLCLLKDLAALAPFSLLGIAGMVYTTAAMAFRYLGGAYKAPAGKFLASIPKVSEARRGEARRSEAKRGEARRSEGLILIPCPMKTRNRNIEIEKYTRRDEPLLN